ncbi:MAG: glycosyltransferase family 4 protein [Caldimonas sp.]
MTKVAAGTIASAPTPRVLIVADHASAKFGGEAALALHYFRVLRARGAAVWLISHARTRDELTGLFGGDARIRFVEDTRLHRFMWRLGRRLPARLAYLTTGYVVRLSSQFEQRRMVRRLIAEQRIDVIHQPMPVSPREPSVLYGFGVPVLIGPMNGGMEWPPAFRPSRGGLARALFALARASSGLLNALLPGKRRAALLLVANQRTREALPAGIDRPVVEMVENGVDFGVWAGHGKAGADDVDDREATTFVFMGRLVDWKAVDLLLHAFERARRRAPMRLLIVGDGDERADLENLARQLQVLATPGNRSTRSETGHVAFVGWLPQTECASVLRQADGLVLPSLLECGGAVVLEAMAMAKPVIATAWGGPMDYLDDSCGILVPPSGRDALVSGLADAMVRLARSPAERVRMGESGYQKVRRLFDWDVKVDRMIEHYKAAMRL